MARNKRPSPTSDKKVAVQYPKHDLGAEWWFTLRDEMYLALEGRAIPESLIHFASGFGYHLELEWRTAPVPGRPISEEDFEIFELEKPSSMYEQELLSSGSRRDGESPRTIAEALALVLSMELETLKKAGKKAPVRVGGLLPRSTIAFIAYDLLRGYEASPPGPYLLDLISELLDIPRHTDEGVRQFAARYRAAHIIAQAPHLESRTIAEELGVDPSSLSRWRRETKFQEMVSRIRAAKVRKPS